MTIPKKYPYEGQMLTRRQLYNLKECVVSYSVLSQRLFKLGRKNTTFKSVYEAVTTPTKKHVRRSKDVLKASDSEEVVREKNEKLARLAREKEKEMAKIAEIFKKPVNPLKDAYLALGMGIML